MSTLTNEQQRIIDKIKDPSTHMLLVSAIAGSGKTKTLTEIAKALQPKSARYLAFNKVIAAEASEKFAGTSVECSTISSLAYRSVMMAHNKPINGRKREIGQFAERMLMKHVKFIGYVKAVVLRQHMEKFFVSKFIKFDDFNEHEEISSQLSDSPELAKKILASAKEYILNSFTGVYPITFNGYLKLYHIWLASDVIRLQNIDLLMLDEIADSNEVTLELFKLVPATKKVGVGDVCQSLYGFNHSVNGFTALSDLADIMYLGLSFRCHAAIANRINVFTSRYLDMDFKGVTIPEPELSKIKTKMYISITNSELINKIIELNESGESYLLARDVNSVFELPLAIASLHSSVTRLPKHLSYLIEDREEYNEMEDSFKKNTSFVSYLLTQYKGDQQITTALSLLIKYGQKKLIQSKMEAAKHTNLNRDEVEYILGTAYSMKGDEADLVEIAPDLNKAVIKAMSKINKGNGDKQTNETMMVAYVSASRAKKQLVNCLFL